MTYVSLNSLLYACPGQRLVDFTVASGKSLGIVDGKRPVQRPAKSSLK